MAVVRHRVSVYCVVVRRESAQLGPRLCGQPIPVCVILVVRTVVSRSTLLSTVCEVGVDEETAGVVCASLAHMPVTVVYQMGVKAAATGPYVASCTTTDAPAVAPSAMEYSCVTGSCMRTDTKDGGERGSVDPDGDWEELELTTVSCDKDVSWVPFDRAGLDSHCDV
jgi:hypothetical protein